MNTAGKMLKKSEKPASHYDVVVIGSGLGGMTAANQLAKYGKKVLLLEAHNKLGGLATWFRRKGDKDGDKEGQHIFDVSLHGFPYGMLKTCKKYWGRNIADRIHPLKEVRFINPQFSLATNFTRLDYEKHLHGTFNVDAQTSKEFFDAVENMNFYDGAKLTNREFFNQYFPGRDDVIRFLLEPMAYANGSTLEDPAISFAIVFGNFVSRGVYIFKGGTDVMIEMMKQHLLDNGVDIKLHSKIEKIEMATSENVRPEVTGVWLKDTLIHTRSVVSNSSLYNTIFKMAGESYFSSDYIQAARAVRSNSSSCQVYIGLKKNAGIDFIGDLIFTSQSETFNTQDILSSKIKSQTYSIYYPDTRPHLSERYAIVSSSNANYDDWVNLNSEEYEKRKQHLMDRAVEDLEKIIPDLKEKIDYIEAATPLTVEKFTHHFRASSFGTKWEGLDVSKKLSSEVHGLFHAGSVGIIMSGWLGAANYGVIQSHEVLQYLGEQHVS